MSFLNQRSSGGELQVKEGNLEAKAVPMILILCNASPTKEEDLKPRDSSVYIVYQSGGYTALTSYRQPRYNVDLKLIVETTFYFQPAFLNLRLSCIID